jgi:hypothetical protein
MDEKSGEVGRVRALSPILLLNREPTFPVTNLGAIETDVIETIVAHDAVFMTNGFPPPAPLLIHTLLDWR